MTMLESGDIIELGARGPKLLVASIKTPEGTTSKAVDELQAALDALARQN